MKKFTLIILSILLPLMASAQYRRLGEGSNVILSNDGIYYETNDDTKTAYVIGCVGHHLWNGIDFVDIPDFYKGDIVIPSKIGEYTVTTIGAFAFALNSYEVTSITLPKTVTKICGDAFSDLPIESIDLTSVTYIHDDAFRRCKNLKSITLGNGLTSIGKGAFHNCSSLTSIDIPSSVTSIGVDAFSGCDNLKTVNIVIYDLSSSFNHDVGRTFYGSSIELHYIYNGEEIKDLVIPEGVTSIGDYVFAGCKSMTSVTIPSSVTSIGKEVFSECSALTSISIPSSVTSIDVDAFYRCNKLSSVNISDLSAWCKIKFEDWFSNPVFYSHRLLLDGNKIEELVIPDDVTSISDYAFQYCDDLKSVTIPNSVTSIGKDAFSNCGYMNSASIPNSVITIGDEAFYACNLETLTIPKSVISIGKGAFAINDLDVASSITVENGNPNYDSRNNCNAIIESKTNKLIAGCKNTIIPNNVTSIGQEAFRFSYGMKSIVIPQNVEAINEDAFYCISLTAICCLRKEPPTCYGNPFSYVGEGNCIIWVPKGCVEAYKEADGWKDFQDIREMIDNDVNLDGKVDYEDVSALATNISNASADINISDINGDNEVNVADVVALINKMNGQALLGETAFYLIGDHNGWDMTDKTYAFTKLADGKTWEITIPSEGAGCFKIAPGSAYDHQDGTFWSYLLCAEYDQYTGLHGIMQQGDIMAAWLLNTEGATSYTIRIVPSEMTYQIIPN